MTLICGLPAITESWVNGTWQPNGLKHNKRLWKFPVTHKYPIQPLRSSFVKKHINGAGNCLDEPAHFPLLPLREPKAVLVTVGSLGQKSIGLYLASGILFHFFQLIDTKRPGARFTMTCCCCCSFQAITWTETAIPCWCHKIFSHL